MIGVMHEMKKGGGSCINLGNEVDAWSGKTGAHASLLGSVGRAELRKHHAPPDREPPAPKAWCPATKEQGLAGREAPRAVRRQPSPMPEA